MIQGHSDHGASREQLNLIWTGVRSSVPLINHDHKYWAGSRSSHRNSDRIRLRKWSTFCVATSSETQGQIVGARESLNGRKNMARRKVKNGEKSPWGQCLTRPVPNGRRRSAFWLGRKTQTFSGTNQKPERRRPFGTGLMRHCPQGLFSPFFTFLRAIFFRPFSLSLTPTICPWVSEDGVATTGLGNERRNSILMTRRYPDLGSNSDWLKICLNPSEAQPRSG